MCICMCGFVYVCMYFSQKDRMHVHLYIHVFSNSYTFLEKKSEAMNKHLYYHNCFCINVPYKSWKKFKMGLADFALHLYSVIFRGFVALQKYII